MIIQNLSFPEYLDMEGLSNSGCGLLEKSPRHFKAGFIESSDALSLGSLVHTLVLEPDDVGIRYAVTGLSLATKEGKAFKAEADANGQEIVKQNTWDDACRMAESVMNHPLAGHLFSAGTPEVSMQVERHDGLMLKGRMDWLRPDEIIVDLKTTQDASRDGFVQSVGKYAYHRQCAFYMDLYNNHQETFCHDFLFVAVESKPPFNTGVYRLTGEFVDAGRERYQRAIEIYLDCDRTGFWPGYSEDVVNLEPKPWMIREA